MKNKKKVEHGPREAAYSNLPGPKQWPWLECLCGWQSSRDNVNWEDVGREFDEHLEGTR